MLIYKFAAFSAVSISCTFKYGTAFSSKVGSTNLVATKSNKLSHKFPTGPSLLSSSVKDNNFVSTENSDLEIKKSVPSFETNKNREISGKPYSELSIGKCFNV